MTTQELTYQIRKKKSFLCIGLDVDLDKIPSHLLKEETLLITLFLKVSTQELRKNVKGLRTHSFLH